MVLSINEIGHLTGKPTTAEWAENAEIIKVLRGLGVDYAQGYGVSQPQRVQRAAIAQGPPPFSAQRERWAVPSSTARVASHAHGAAGRCRVACETTP
jgi:EAL domain-containing protein (putative c-di-GMP-specific phosphodiesterase class I)